MTIVGLNLGKTCFYKPLRDGSVCILGNDNIKMIIAEERISRQKRAGGYESALKYSLGKLGLSEKDIDIVAYSSCCEPLRNNFQMQTKHTTRYLPVNHHLSHAYSVYMLSPFEESLIMVIDAGGNTLDNVNPDWWASSREQHSYYMAKGNTITLLERDFEKQFSAGIGEIYRAFTYYLGWSSSQYAGKTMALAAYGDPERFSNNSIFTFNEDGSLTSNITNNPHDPISMIEDILRVNKITDVKKREPKEPIEQLHKDIACWIQSEVEKAVFAKITYLVEKTGIKKLCLSGGVAYNCRLNGKILLHTPIEEIFVHPGSGDHGQCLGNAIYAYSLSHTNSNNRFESFHPYWGGEEDITIEKVLGIVGSTSKIKVSEPDSYINKAVELIADGNIICWFQGRSEYGPRALGNRSILADPRDERVRKWLNKIKGRENFMPFAPSVLAEKASEYFDIKTNSPYMTYAVKVKSDMKKFIPAVVHEDGTARVHTVTREANPLFYSLIEEFYKLSMIPMLLNTSFNKPKEPIVETLEDALNSFFEMDIDYLIAGNLLIKKIKSSIDTHISNYNELSVDFTIQGFDFEKLKNLIEKKFPEQQLFPRIRFALYFEFVNWLKTGKKTTTIRYRRGGIDFLQTPFLDIIETPDFTNGELYHKKVGRVEIKRMVIKNFGMLSEEDARLDGFHSLQELKETLNKIYGNISDGELVTIYNICLINE